MHKGRRSMGVDANADTRETRQADAMVDTVFNALPAASPAQSITFPERAIARVSSAVSVKSMERKNTAIARAETCSAAIDPSHRPLTKYLNAFGASASPFLFS